MAAGHQIRPGGYRQRAAAAGGGSSGVRELALRRGCQRQVVERLGNAWDGAGEHESRECSRPRGCWLARRRACPKKRMYIGEPLVTWPAKPFANVIVNLGMLAKLQRKRCAYVFQAPNLKHKQEIANLTCFPLKELQQCDPHTSSLALSPSFSPTFLTFQPTTPSKSKTVQTCHYLNIHSIRKTRIGTFKSIKVYHALSPPCYSTIHFS